MRFNRRFWFVLLPLGVAACSTWSTTTVKPAKADVLAQAAGSPSGGAAAQIAPMAPSSEATAPRPGAAAEAILLTEDDITDRPYKAIGDIKVTVRKTTLFNKDPTRADVDAKLRKEAIKLGADAVVLVRYGTVGIGMTSWGVLHGEGRAVKFQ
ncbi:MAG: hypothetical protein ACR2FH_01230 [Caulobacteraceae bacterium]